MPVGDARRNKGKAVSPYRLKFDRKGDALVLRINDALGPVKDFDLFHEKYMHLIVVTKDLQNFAHVHPELQADGSFLLGEIPLDGDLRFFADFAPRGKGSQVLSFAMKADKKRSAPTDRLLAPAQLLPLHGPWAAGKTQPVHYSTATPLSAFEKYLGEFGHLVMIHEDAETYVHAHPLEDPAKLIFLARPPKPGKYRAWVETKSAGQLYRQSFSVEVAPRAGR